MNTLLVYLICISSNAGNVIFGLGITIVAFYTLICFFLVAEGVIESKDISFRGLIIGLALILGSVFIPSTKQSAAIYIIPKIAKNHHLEKMPKKILNLANDWIDELSPKNKTH